MKIIRHNGSELAWQQFGKGPKRLIAFHGFGQSSGAYKPLAAALTDYTIYSFDLFYHGNSRWRNNHESIKLDDWAALMRVFLHEARIEDFDVAGFSLGGKFALATIHAFPSHIQHAFFIAPDGIQTQMWYSLATYPYIFMRYFESMITKPHRFQRIIQFLEKYHMIDKGLSKFAASQMDSEEKRKRVFYSWTIFKHFKFNLRETGQLMNSHNISSDFFIGKYDKIITAQGVQKLTQYLGKYTLHKLDTGHNNLIEQTAAFLKQNS